MVVETEDAEGFRRGRKLHKIGMDSADTSELFFEDCRSRPRTCSAPRGPGLCAMMTELPQERLIVAVMRWP